VVVMIGVSVRGGLADDPKPLSAADVIAQWEPKLEGVEDFQRFMASPKESPAMAACTFRVVGPSFGALWNHFADLCGIPDRYQARRSLVSLGSVDKGSYVVSERAAADADGGRGLTVFLLRTDGYSVTVTIGPDPAGKVLLGSIAAVTSQGGGR
jgi:hypothetical protein